MDLSKLNDFFPPEDIEWRVGSTNKQKTRGLALAYITNRAIMDRLDAVVGPENWRNEFTPGPSGGVLCGVSIRVGDEWVTKWDGAENTDFEAVKGGLSGAMKRAAVQWGIGRYLYHLPASWVPLKDGKYMDEVPAIPVEFLPEGTPPPKPKKKKKTVDPPPSDGNATVGDLKRIRALGREIGIGGKEELLDTIAVVIGREIAQGVDLVSSEVEQVVEQFETWKAEGRKAVTTEDDRMGL